MSSGTGRALLLAPHPCSLHCASKMKVYHTLCAVLSCHIVIYKVPHSWVWRFSWLIFVTYNSSSSSGVREMNQPALCHVLGGIQGALSVLTGVCLFSRTYFTHPGECWAGARWERVCSYTESRKYFWFLAQELKLGKSLGRSLDKWFYMIKMALGDRGLGTEVIILREGKQE